MREGKSTVGKGGVPPPVIWKTWECAQGLMLAVNASAIWVQRHAGLRALHGWLAFLREPGGFAAGLPIAL